MKTNDYARIESFVQLRAARKTLSEEIAAIDEKYTRRLKTVFRLWHTLCEILSHG